MSCPRQGYTEGACCERRRPSLHMHRARVRRLTSLPAGQGLPSLSKAARRCRRESSPTQPRAAYSMRGKQSAAPAHRAPQPLAPAEVCSRRGATARCSSFSADSVGPLHGPEEELPWPPEPRDWRTPRGLALAMRRGTAEGVLCVLPVHQQWSRRGWEGPGTGRSKPCNSRGEPVRRASQLECLGKASQETWTVGGIRQPPS